MAGKEFNIVAVLYPKKGKTDQLVELLDGVAKYVLENEPGTLKYEVNRSLRPAKDGTEDVIMLERYKDQESLKLHGSSKAFTEFQEKLKELVVSPRPCLRHLLTRMPITFRI